MFGVVRICLVMVGGGDGWVSIFRLNVFSFIVIVVVDVKVVVC